MEHPIPVVHGLGRDSEAREAFPSVSELVAELKIEL